MTTAPGSLADYGGAWLGAHGKAHCRDLDFDVRISPLPRLPVQPHVVLGMGFKRLAVDNAPAMYFDDDMGVSRIVCDAVYSGISWDAGLGASVLVMPRLLLDFSAVHCSNAYHSISYHQVGGSLGGPWHDNVHVLRGPGWSLRGSLLWRFAWLGRMGNRSRDLRTPEVRRPGARP
jgi:hypothetical protein